MYTRFNKLNKLYFIAKMRITMTKKKSTFSPLTELIFVCVFDVVVAVFITICVIDLFTFNPNTYTKSYKTTIKNVVSANEKEIVDVIKNERLKESVLILKYDDVTLRETKETENKEFMAELHCNTISYKILNNKSEKVSESEDSNPLTFF